MLQQCRTALVAVVAVFASALMLLPGAALGAPRSQDRQCGRLSSARIVDILAERVTCRTALVVVRQHARSAQRRGACGPGRVPATCRLEGFECASKTFDDIGTRVYCFARGDRKVVFRYLP